MTVTLSAKGFVQEWAKDKGARGAAAELVLMQIEDYETRVSELESALRGLLSAAEDARWPLTAEQMLPMNQARRALGVKPR